MEKKNQELAKKAAIPIRSFSETQNNEKPDKSYFESHTIGVLTIPK